MSTKIYDDWRAETQLRLKQSQIYLTLVKRCQEEPTGPQVLSLVDDTTFYAYQRAKTILMHMKEFTLHDADHLFRVLNLMERLIPKEKLEMLSTPELLLLILSAFFHDLGMAPSESEVKAWLKIWNNEEPNEYESLHYEKFKRFCEGRPEKYHEYLGFLEKKEIGKANLIIEFLVSEYIRITHAQRIKEIIKNEWEGKIKFRDKDLSTELAQVCFSHNESADHVLNLDDSLLCAPGIYACLPFVAIILRLADILDFDSKRTPQVLFSHLSVRNPISIKEWNKHRSIEAWDIRPEIIVFHASCEHPVVEATIRSFCDYIDNELMAANSILSNLSSRIRNPFPEYYRIKFPISVDRSKIGPKKDALGDPSYEYHFTQFNLSKEQVVDLLMGTKLYGNPELALRELIQNSIDACMVRSKLEEAWGAVFKPKIKVRFFNDGKNDYLEVEDNGIGMDYDIIKNFYSKVGSSFYKSTEFYELQANNKIKYNSISRFGIGVLSFFMISDSINVNTQKLYKPYKSGPAIEINIEGKDSIFWIKKGDREEPGTKTQLLLKSNHPWVGYKGKDEDLVKLIHSFVPNPVVEIEISVNSKTFSYTSGDFSTFTKDFVGLGWDEDEFVKQIEIELDKNTGITGRVLIGIIEKDGSPVKTIEITSRDIEIEFSTYSIGKELNYSHNKIETSSDSIEIDDGGNIQSHKFHSDLAKSWAKISYQGINIPMDLFPNWWDRKQKIGIDWPLPVGMVIDIDSKWNLQLNSARTEIIDDENWEFFEDKLAEEICKNLKSQLGDKYFNDLKKIFLEDKYSDKDNSFIKALDTW